MSIFSPSGWNLESPNRDNSTARADDRLVHLNRRSSYSYKLLAIGNRWFTIVVLCFVNLINYMDRYTLAGVLIKIQADLKINDDDAGLIQTVFIISYMIFAPIFGYFGDRYSRRSIIIIGVVIWSTTTFFGSFVNDFRWFLFFRGLVGIGEASYSTIAPTIISDLYLHQKRSIMLALFYFAIPVGCGLGYILGSGMESFANDWRWALRVTPFLGILAIALLLFIKDPVRGAIEGSHHVPSTTYCEDIKSLAKKKSFIFSSAGFTCVTFVAGALSWWAPKFIYLGLRLQPQNEELTQGRVSFIFGFLSMLAGIIGVTIGTVLSQKLVTKYPKADPFICGCGLLLSAPLLAGSMLLVTEDERCCYGLIFASMLTLNLNWSIVADILLYVVEPGRRSSAEAIQILASHAFGDACSPYLVGLISVMVVKYINASENRDEIDISHAISRNMKGLSIETEFKALQYALFSTCFVDLLGGIFFLITSLYLIEDKNDVIDHIALMNARRENERRAMQRTRPNQQILPSEISS